MTRGRYELVNKVESRAVRADVRNLLTILITIDTAVLRGRK